MEFSHISVLLRECVETLLPPDRAADAPRVFVDCTAGGGGHSYAIASRMGPADRLICLDRDDAALAACRSRLAEFGDRVTLVKSNFEDVGAVLDSLGIEAVDGVLWDLGVSSYQLDEKSRGFSYTEEAPLDMRMDTTTGMTAAEILASYSENELTRIFRDYGEERFAARIAHNVCEIRQTEAIETTTQFAQIITESIPAAARAKEHQHPARRAFQGLRIEVNGELKAIEPSLRDAVRKLRKGGRAAVITFHSLEDRIAKQTFTSLTGGCTCPPNFPVCVCGRKPVITLLNKKPILPSEEEIAVNPRAHSAKLRTAEKL